MMWILLTGIPAAVIALAVAATIFLERRRLHSIRCGRWEVEFADPSRSHTDKTQPLQQRVAAAPRSSQSSR